MTTVVRPGGLLARLRGPWRILVKEVAAFGVVSSVAFVIQIGLLYALLHQHMGPLTANAIAVVAATAVAYFGNRHYSFSHRARTGLARETSIFFAINAVAFALSEVMVAVAAYPLGYRNNPHVIVAVTIASIAIGTLFRFWSYKRFVFLHPDKVQARNVDFAGASTRDSTPP
jgi:putative flippase GtrA